MTEAIRRCSCGAALNPTNTTDMCAECAWWVRSAAAPGGYANPVVKPNPHLPAPGAPSPDEVDERTGLLNVITILPTRVPDAVPVVTVHRTTTDRYRVEFDFSPRATTIIKETVPAAVRRWRRGAKHWEISTDWAGPLVAALRNAGVTVTGLGAAEDAEFLRYCLAPVPISKTGHQAYTEGRCAICTRCPHRAGDLACDRCHDRRLARAHRVHSALATKGLARWPTAVPSGGMALRCRYPLWAFEDDEAAVTAVPDYADAVDAVLTAAREDVEKPPCPICGRRPAKGVAVHVKCRRHLFAALASKPFVRPRNRAFQDGQCTVCTTRPLMPSGTVCDHCAGLLMEIKK
jgi:hypothetical protein